MLQNPSKRFGLIQSGYYYLFLIVVCLVPLTTYADNLPTPKDYQKLTTPQIWEGKNGKSIRGTFKKRDGEFITVTDSEGRERKFAIINLSDKTRSWFFRAWQFKQMKEGVENVEEAKRRNNISTDTSPEVQRDQQLDKKPNDRGVYTVELRPGRVVNVSPYWQIETAGYKKIPAEKTDRSKLPNYNQSDFGNKASDCVPNSYAMFVAWWHKSHWINIPGRERDFNDKVDWLHKRLSRGMRTRNNSGTSNSRNITGLQTFMTKEVMTNAAFTMARVWDYQPENMAKYTEGANGTVLLLSVYNGRKYSDGHAVALKRAHADGTLEFHTWGLSLQGKLKELPGEKVKAWGSRPKYVNGKWQPSGPVLPRYEIEIADRESLPEWFKNQETRFILDASQYDQLIVLTPYLPEFFSIPDLE